MEDRLGASGVCIDWAFGHLGIAGFAIVTMRCLCGVLWGARRYVFRMAVVEYDGVGAVPMYILRSLSNLCSRR